MSANKDLDALQETIGYHFKNIQLLKTALTHSSFANEHKKEGMRDYERLEFLGDSVLEMVSSSFLYRNYPNKKEGEMTKMRASMVCEVALAFCAQDIKLADFILLGKGEELTGGRNRDSIVSDVMEAVIGAIYLDGGLMPASEHINRFILSDLENKQVFYDSKSILQELAQAKGQEVHYELIGTEGPEHDCVFHVQAFIEDKKIGEGKGRTKKAAEQKAAYEGVLLLRK